MKKLNIMLGCLLIASGTLSACSYYDGSVEREIDGTQQQNSSDKACTSDDTCTRTEHCVMCTDAFVSRNLCKLSSAKQCVAVKYGGEACTNNNDCATNECVPDEGNNTICSCSPVDETAPCADDNQFCKLAASGNYLCADKAKLGENCTETEDALPCAPGLRCNGGKCATIIKENESCGAENTVCDEGLECKESICVASSGEIIISKDIGDDCYSDDECKSGLVCQMAKEGKKQCSYACTIDTDCGDPTLYCNNNRCTLIEGESCSAEKKCGNGFFCSPANICMLNGTEGFPCTDNKSCTDGHFCASVEQDDGSTINICAKVNPEGGECANDSMCESGVCDMANLRCSRSCKKNADCGGDDKLGERVCNDGICRNVVGCPNDNSKKCLLAFRMMPNLNWNYGEISNSWVDPSVGDYYGNIFALLLPSQTYAKDLDFCARPLGVFQSFVGDENETHIDDPIEDPIGTSKKIANGEKVNYVCTTEAKNAGNLMTKYPGVKATLQTIMGLTTIPAYKYAAELVNVLLKSAVYVDAPDIGKPVFPDGLASLGTMLDKMTCREFVPFYRVFGYDFTTILQTRYPAGRFAFPCIEVSLGRKLPFTLKYRDSRWKNRDFYMTIKLFPSPLMEMSDAYSVGIAPCYEDKDVDKDDAVKQENNYSTIINFNNSNSYTAVCKNQSINAQGCIQDLTSKFVYSKSKGNDYGFNILVTYTKDENNFSCDDKNVRLGTCMSSLDALTEFSHSGPNDCGYDALHTNYSSCENADNEFKCKAKLYNDIFVNSKIDVEKIEKDMATCMEKGNTSCKKAKEYNGCIKDNCSDDTHECCTEDDKTGEKHIACCEKAHNHQACCDENIRGGANAKLAAHQYAIKNCIPTLAINAISFQAFIELSDEDRGENSNL